MTTQSQPVRVALPEADAANRRLQLLTLPEVADMLRKSEAQVRWMLYNNAAPKSAKIGGRRMFRLSDVEAWVNAQFDDGEAA